MVKTLWIGLSVGALAALGACSTDNSTPLKDLSTMFGETHVEIVANTQVSVLLHVASDGCVTLSDHTVATFDGQQMEMTHGGYAEDASGCYPIAFWFKKFPENQIGAREKASGGADMVIQDESASWKIAPTQLFGNDLELDASTNTILWPNVDHISTVHTVPTVGYEIQPAAIKLAAGAQIQSATATAYPLPTLCAGPDRCTIDLSRTRDFTKISPQ